MKDVYKRTLVEKNSFYGVYYGAGEFFGKDHNTNLHYDTDITVSFFKNCNGEIRIEGKRYRISSGDVVIMNPNEIHCCDIEEGSFHERISLYISKDILKLFPFECSELFDCFYNREGGVKNLIPSEMVRKYGIGEVIGTVLALSKKQTESGKTLTVCKIIELLSDLNDASACQTELTVENKLISDVIGYIGENFMRDLNSEKIAEEFYISKFRLEHLFKECVGLSLWDYVIMRRLLFFNELVQKGETVKNASFTAGFNNYSNFYRLYKKHMNMTPEEYKKTSRN